MTFRPRFEVKQLSALRHTVVKGLAKVTEGLVLMPNRHNAIYTHSHFIHGIVNAAHQNKSIGKTANTQRSKFKDIHGSPTDEWFRLRMKNMSLKEINQVLAKCMEDNIKRIKDASPELFQDWESNGMTVGIDMHLQRRYDKKAKDATDEEVDEWMEESFLNKTRYEKGTVLCNTFATISCITKRSSFFLGSIMIQKGTTKAEAVKKLLDMADELTVKSSLALLDRGFHSTDTIHAMNDRMAEREKDKSAPPFNFIIQCARTPSVVKALDEYAVGNRPAESEASIVGGIQGDNGGPSEAKYYMHIVKSTSFDSKKKREEEKAKKNNGRVSKCTGCGQVKKEKVKLDIEAHPGLQYTAFACGRLGTDVPIYPDRPMNESGYRAIEEQMPRTCSTDPATRLFCFAIAIILYNLMIVANHKLIAMSRYPPGAKPWHTHDVMVGQFLNVLKSLLDEIGCPEPKPPTPLPS